MKRSCLFLASMFCASTVFAELPAPNATESAASALVDKQVLAPLQKAESKRRRFSRAAPVAVERRVRVLDEAVLTDVRGKQFVRFAIDERRGFDADGPWRRDSVVGCAYLDERQVFVRRGEAYLPARSLLGEDTKDRADVCRPDPAGAQRASAK